MGYDHYNINSYEIEISKIISKENISVVFLNLTNTIKFSKFFRLRFPSIKIVLCSHGNESGDFLHEIALHQQLKGINKLLGYYNLGKMLCIESVYRQYIDLLPLIQ